MVRKKKREDHDSESRLQYDTAWASVSTVTRIVIVLRPKTGDDEIPYDETSIKLCRAGLGWARWLDGLGPSSQAGR